MFVGIEFSLKGDLRKEEVIIILSCIYLVGGGRVFMEGREIR